MECFAKLAWQILIQLTWSNTSFHNFNLHKTDILSKIPASTSKMFSSFQQAARLNNEGVTALVEGNEHQAVDALMKTVRMMKQLLVTPETDIEALSDEKDDGDSSCHDDLNTVEVPDASSGENCYFRQAILLPCDGEESSLDIYVYSAAVIFNLALAHHVQARNGKSYTIKAEKLYSTILKLLDDRVGHMQPAIVLKLACINNMSYIRFENGNYDQVREGLSELSTLLKKTDKVLFEGAKAQGLLMSVLLLKDPLVAPAA